MNTISRFALLCGTNVTQGKRLIAHAMKNKKTIMKKKHFKFIQVGVHFD